MPTSGARQEAEKVNLLLVDDRPENLIALEAILESPGHNLLKAQSGPEALKILLKHDVAVILLDVMMPEMDGFELASIIKQREQSRHIPIIFLTALAKDTVHLYRGYNVGAVDYLSKPLDPQVVRSKVDVFVDLYRKNRQIQAQAVLLQEKERKEKEYRLAELRRASERRYRQLAESIPQMVWIARPDGAIQYFNKRWSDYTGLERGAGPDLSAMRKAVHPADDDKLVAAWKEAVRKTAPLEVEIRIRRADGCYYWHLCRALPQFDAHEVLEEWLGTNTDIHEQKTARDVSELMAQVSCELVGTLDAPTTLRSFVQSVTKSFASSCSIRLTGVEPLFGQSETSVEEAREAGAAPSAALSEHLAEVGREVLRTRIARILLDLPSAIQDGAGRSAIVAPLVAHEKVYGTIAFLSSDSLQKYGGRDLMVAEDLARRVSLALHSADLFARVNEASNAKSAFLANVSHELRTPLGAIMGFAEFLASDRTKPEQRTEYCRAIIRNSKQLTTLIDDILDLSKVEAGKMKVEKIQTSLPELLLETVGLLRAQAESKGIVIAVSGEGPLPSTIVTDPVRFRQILVNLIGNAVKFTERGSVKVVARLEDGKLSVRVSDTGCGIKQEHQAQLFQPFMQADVSTTRKFGGTGLGLALSKRLAGELGGHLRLVESEPRVGTVFEVSIDPGDLAKVSMIAQLQPVAAQAKEKKPQSPFKVKELAGARILVAEDSEDNQYLIGQILKGSGAEAEFADNGAMAVELALAKEFDVVLMDIQMPVLDGREATRKLRQQGYAKPIIALTAHAMVEEHERSIEAGCDDHLTKPINIKELVTKIRKHWSPEPALAQGAH